jgi:hypothetical protein
LPAKHPIFTAPNTVLPPHVGFETFGAISAKADVALHHLENFPNGRGLASQYIFKQIVELIQNGAKLGAVWMVFVPQGDRRTLLALHFGDFQRRKPEIHCADDAVHLL